MNLFLSEENKALQLDLPDADVVYYPNFFSKEKADTYFKTLLSETNWQQDDITAVSYTHLTLPTICSV